MNKQEQDDFDKTKRERTNSKRKFTRKCNAFMDLYERKVPILVLQEKFDDIRESYKELAHVNDRLVTIINETAQHDVMDDMLDDCDAYMNDIEAAQDNIRIVFASHLQENNVKSADVRVRPFNAPSFTGNIREYPSFKQDFERLMMTTYGEDPYALRSCLSGPALATVRGVEDNFKEMFHRLENAYGDPRKIVDAVINDIKTLKPVADGENKSFVAMVDVIERCWLDLQRMDLAGEMDSVTMVSMIEKLLPTTQKREWVLRIEAKNMHSKIMFSELLQFLLQEKRVIKYMDHDLRIAGRPRGVHHTQSHGTENSTENEIDLKNGVKGSIENQSDCQERLVKELERVTTCLGQLLQTSKMNFENHCPDRSKRNLSSPSSSKWCWVHNTPAHSIEKCNVFSKMSLEEKQEAVRKSGACFNCLQQTGHIARDCTQPNKCDVPVGNRICGKRHHSLLHKLETAASAEFRDKAVNNVKAEDHPTLLAISTATCNDKNVTILWDSGSDISLITHNAAARLDLRGRNVDLSIVRVGNNPAVLKSKEYTVPLVDLEGKIHEICAYGMDEITSCLQRVNMDQVAARFPDLNQTDIKRPKGEVDLLIGVDQCGIMPIVIKTVGNTQLLKNQFGYCVRGSFGETKSTRKGEREDKQVSINHINVTPHLNAIRVESAKSITNSLEQFFNIESLGTSCTPKCGGCRCGRCSHGMGDYTLKEERELALIRQGLQYDGEENVFIISYPWIKDPGNLPNNVNAAKAKLRSTERRLSKLSSDHQQAYQDQMEGMEKRGVSRKLTQKEIQEYKGPVHYIHHHEVLKPNSASTPVRIVFNSSASYMGHVLNDYWAKGPDVINNLFGILVRFREYPVAITADISKMYNSIRMSKRDQHVHRYLWRGLQDSPEPNHYVLTAVPFGDRPSGTIAMTALHTIAKMHEKEYPDAAKVILENTYVDDLIHSTETDHEARSLATDIQGILTRGSFKIKEWVISGQNKEPPRIQPPTQQQKVLGVLWNPQLDQFSFEVKLNFSPKHKNNDTDQDLTKGAVECAVPQILTKRLLLRQIAAVFDPLGLIAPFMVQGKLLMRRLLLHTSNETSNWDTPVPVECRNEWMVFFKDTFDVKTCHFPRCTKPLKAIGDPILVIFSDASSQAYGACAYVRWQLPSGNYETFLIAAKNRIAPTRQLTIPRLELCAAVIGCRLGESLQKQMTYNFCEVVYIVDSIIVRSQIQKESYGFGTFVATRVGEIQEKSDPNQWWWIEGRNNPADMLTRPSKPENLRSGSVWQTGPEFLRAPRTTWPVSQSLYEQELPDRNVVSLMAMAVKSNNLHFDVDKVIKAGNFSSYDKLLRVTARILNAVSERSLKGIGSSPNTELVSMAETAWVKAVQKPLMINWQNRFKRLGPNLTNEGLLTVGSRIARWLKDSWNQQCYILLPPDHPFTKLFILKMHNRDHGGVETTLARLQSKFWVPGARRLIKGIRQRCITCKKLLKQTQSQSMGPVIPERLKPTPAFYHTALDLFGPFVIKDTVKRRTKSKAFGVIFTCLASRAVYIDLAEGYSTQDFLIVFRRFITLGDAQLLCTLMLDLN